MTGENLKIGINVRQFVDLTEAEKRVSVHLVVLKRVTIPNLDRVVA